MEFFIAALVLAWFARALFYRQELGRWVWWRLREDELKRLLPRDPKAAYARGYREGVKAAQSAESKEKSA